MGVLNSLPLPTAADNEVRRLINSIAEVLVDDNGRHLASTDRKYEKFKTDIATAIAPHVRGANQDSQKVVDEIQDQIHARAWELGKAQNGDPEPFVRKLKFGREGDPSPQSSYKRLAALSSEHSFTEWTRAHGIKGSAIPQGTDRDELWNAFGAGILGQGWDRWNDQYARIFNTLGTGGEGGELVPTVLAGDVIDRLRAATPIFQAGAMTVPMPSKVYEIARLTTDPTATAWHAESAAITADTAMQLDKVTFTAKTLPCLVKSSRELVEDAPNVGSVVRDAMVASIGVELTRAALRGDGTSNSPTGIRNATGVELHAIGANGGPVTIDMLIDRVTAIREANTEPDAIIWHPRTSGGVTKLAKDSNGNYFPLPSPLAELGKYTTTAIPKNLTKGTGTNLSEAYMGRWAELMVGIRTALQVRALRERYSDTGDIGFEAWLRADIQLAHGASFSVITDTTT